MRVALEEARCAGARGEVPVGAAISGKDGTLIASAGNRIRELQDATAHAEILAIRRACREVGDCRLNGCTIHVTLEPCAMCAAAISHARLERLVYGASDPKSGGVEQGGRIFEQAQTHHRPEVISGIGESESAALLRQFFAELRKQEGE